MTDSQNESKNLQPMPRFAPLDGKRVQMVDVARLAGVSLATVSRALNAHPSVSEETRLRITELAKSLNYTINISAQTLRAGAHNTVAVIIPFFQGKRQHVTDPFFLSMLGSLGDALTERGFDMLFSRIDSADLESAADLVRSGRAKGLIVIGQSGHHQRLNTLAVQGIPLVVWGAQLPQQSYVTVGGDNVMGGKIATEHLLDAGCSRILFVGDNSLPEIEHRHRGFVQAHLERDRVADPSLIVPTPFLADIARSSMAEFLSKRRDFDGIFAASDLLAISCAYALKDAGLVVPQDVRLVGYDDVEAAAHFSPPLSTVRQPIIEAGAVMVESLVAQIKGESESERIKPQILPTVLVQRQSV